MSKVLVLHADGINREILDSVPHNLSGKTIKIDLEAVRKMDYITASHFADYIDTSKSSVMLIVNDDEKKVVILPVDVPASKAESIFDDIERGHRRRIAGAVELEDIL